MKPTPHHLACSPAFGRNASPCLSSISHHSSLITHPLHSSTFKLQTSRRVPRRRAFTLIEVLIAMFVFTLAVVAISSAFTDTLTTLGTLSVDRTPVEDLRFVRSTVVQESDLAKFEEGGEIETLSCGMATWSAVVEPTTVSDLFDVELSITLTPPNALDNNRNSRPQEETYVFQLRLLRPTWSQAGDRTELLRENKQRRDSLLSEQGLR